MVETHKYRVYCNTEEAYVESAYLESELTVCPNNIAHTIDTNSIIAIAELSTNSVKIIEEETPTNGNYRLVGYEYTCPVGESTHDITFKIPVNIISVQYTILSENVNDIVHVHAGPDTIIGVVTADVTAGDTVFNVNSTVTDNIYTGLNLRLDDGTNKDNLEYIISYDKVAGTVTTNTGAVNSFSAATPTYVKATSYVVENLKLKTAGVYKVADDKTTKNYLDANRILRILYTNNGTEECNFYFYLAFMD